MAESMPTKQDAFRTPSDPLRHAFGLLASAELGRQPAWSGPQDAVQLRARVELLALLLDIVPRSELNRLNEVIASWSSQFPEQQHVSVTKLREVARAVLKLPGDWSLHVYREAPGLRRALALTRCRTFEREAESSFDPALGFSAAEAERQYAVGLGMWFDQMGSSPRWRFLPGVVPGEAPAPIDKVYVELFAISDQAVDERHEEDMDRPQRLSRRLLASEYPVVSVPTIVARTMQCCVVMGEPGSGKSTLIQWLAWATYQQQIPDFDAALVVKLSAFATALDAEPTLSILEFFFDCLGSKIDDWRPAAYWLRRVAGEGHRFLLLLDGWDEVSIHQRERVRERILAEEPYFITVITSRPSGLPRQLYSGESVDFYHIAGLASGAIENLVRNLLANLRHPDLFEPILERIRDESDLREMEANPFLLGLLVRVLMRTAGSGAIPRTLADVYQQVVTWVQEQYNHARNQTQPLAAEHLAALRRLSHGLLFADHSPRYLFHGQELAECLGECSTEPIFRSRFVNRIDPVFDEYTFLHATFQEYFAAGQAATFSAEDQDKFLEQAFHSVSRLIVLEFMAGMSGRASARCRERALDWVLRRDRFQQVLLRLARVVAAGRWPADDPPGLGQLIRNDLWEEIRHNHNMALTARAVEAFAELDPVGLARRARAASGLDNWAIQCIVDAVPASVGRQEQLDELLDGAWRDVAGFDAKGGGTDADRQAVLAALTNPTLDRDDLRTASIQAGALRDPGTVPALLRFLADGSVDHELQEQAIDSLGVIASRDAIDSLVDIVTGDRRLPAESVSMAVALLSHRGQNRKALDPIGRDRLLRRLAVLAPEDERLESILLALEGCPLREGAALIDQLARKSEVNVAVRTAAIRVLATVTDRQRVQQLVTTIESEPSGEVVDTLLELAVGRSLAVPLPWLEKKIAAARDKVKRRILLTAYVLVAPLTAGIQRQKAATFLDRLALRALTENSAGGVELAEALDQALARAGKSVSLFSEETCRCALDVLERFTAVPEKVDPTRLLLAVSIVKQLHQPGHRSILRDALDAALRLYETLPQHPDRLSRSIANTLAEIAPAELLRYPPECDCVQSVLRGRAVERGWLVYDRRITDAEGVEIATIQPAETALIAMMAKSVELKDLIDQLPPNARRVLYTYWLVVKEGGPCQPSDTQKSIYAALQVCHSGAADDPIARAIDQLFPEGLPNFASWRKALKRIEERFAGQPEALAQLRRIGLCRRRPRAR